MGLINHQIMSALLGIVNLTASVEYIANSGSTTMTQIRSIIIEETINILKDKGVDQQTIASIGDETAFLRDTDMDSLDLATLIVCLEMRLEYDPFCQGFKTFNTLGELVDLYAPGHVKTNNQPIA